MENPQVMDSSNDPYRGRLSAGHEELTSRTDDMTRNFNLSEVCIWIDRLGDHGLRSGD